MSDYRNNPEYLRQRRAIIRRYHPDAGGSDAELIEAFMRSTGIGTGGRG